MKDAQFLADFLMWVDDVTYMLDDTRYIAHSFGEFERGQEVTPLDLADYYLQTH